MARILALDIGEKRIGLALSDPQDSLAFPFGTIEPQKEEPISEIKKICQENDVFKIVIGLPLTMRGEEGEEAKKVKKFAQRLASRLSLEIIFEDERLTSQLVEKLLITEGASRKRRKSLKDTLAAKFILQGYLDKEKAKNEDRSS